MNKTALLLHLGDPSSDQRPRRMIELMQRQGFLVDLLSHSPIVPVQVREHFLIRSSSLGENLLRRLLLYVRKCSVILLSGKVKDWINDQVFGTAKFRPIIKNRQYNLVIVEDLFMLPLAMSHKHNAQIVFDAREYYSRQNEESFWWRMLERPERIRLCKSYLKQCDQVLTVSPGLAREYQREFGVSASIYRNVPYYTDREIMSTGKKYIKLVHHGVANPNRQLEKMIDIVSQLDSRFSLDMYLTGCKTYIDYLKSYAKSVPAVRFCEPVTYDKIIPMLNQYDIGFFYVEPSTFNLLHCLPNKLFEFIQARLAVAIGPSPDMSDIVKAYRCGVIADEFSITDMAKKLNALTYHKIDELKHNSDIAARQLNFEVESKKFLKILESLGRNE